MTQPINGQHYGPDLRLARPQPCVRCGRSVYGALVTSGDVSRRIWLEPGETYLTTDVDPSGMLAVMKSEAMIPHVCYGDGGR